MAITLDRETGTPVTQDTASYTRAEIAGMRAPCPRCGTAVTFGAVDVAGLETVGDRHYRIGRPQYSCGCFNG